MLRTILIAGLVIAVLGAGVYALVANRDAQPATPASQTPTTATPDPSPPTTQTTAPPTTDQSPLGRAVEIKDYAYSPATLTVKKGTKVTWTNQDGVGHDVTPDSASDAFKRSDLLAKGQSYSVVFNTVGTYSYHCSPHSYMKATVVVTE